MKAKYLIVALGLLAGASASARAPVPADGPQADGCYGPQSATKLFVDVHGLRNAKGLVAVTLYADDRSKFLVRHGSLYVARAPTQSPNTRVCIHLPTPGVYAVAVYHDEDSSRKLNRSMVGTPTEGFGFSNNPSTFFGLPNFTKVRLNVPRTNGETTINMRYP
jgi:uncharacterized protein (DUF2141 family)